MTYLRVRSEYSLLRSCLRMEDLARTARERGVSALALTDVGNLYGIVSFFKACRKYGIHPIAGVELQAVEQAGSVRDPKAPAYSLILLAENQTGYKNLLKLVTRSHLEGGTHGHSRICLSWLAELAEGCIALTGWEDGAVGQALLAGNAGTAYDRLAELRDLVGAKNLFVEVQDRGRVSDRPFNLQLASLAEKAGVQLAAVQTVSYLDAGDSDVLMALEAIREGKSLPELEPAGWRFNGQALPRWEEFQQRFHYLPQAVQNLGEIAARCHASVGLGETHMPAYPIPEGFATDDEYLRYLALQGVQERYGTKGCQPEAGVRVMERLEMELQTISQMGFSSYFLIVWDFMAFAHRQNIRSGPGRGSAAGSLVAYLLNITDVDPLKYGLLMERFLNPERVSWPDIDIDFEYERRLEVIEYVAARYGADRVAQIITFGTLAARAAIRDVGRVLGKSQAETDRLAKAIPASLGITLGKALETEPDLAKMVDADPAIRHWYRLAQRIEGLPRHTSIHAAGVVISARPLTDYVALQPGPENVRITQLAMEDIEAIGLLKMDFLGLRTLTLIDRTLASVKSRHGRPVVWDADMQDELTYHLLSRGQTDGCFQLESTGVKLVLRELKPTAFEDIIAVISLYRPGPMENIPLFIKAKHGQKKAEYPHPSLEPILRDTYGVIVYQEQIMQIASFMAGFTLGQADLLRRAVGKKKREVLDENRTLFVAGCLQNGYAKEIADEVYDLIVRFADYGFNRSHAAAYGVLSYRTAYLKAHYPAEFLAALMSLWVGSPAKLSLYVEDARRLGIRVAGPDINLSQAEFVPERGASGEPLPAVRFALAAVKHVGLAAIQAILSERQKSGPFRGLFDFCRRVDQRSVNRRCLESLICAGAFDFTGFSRRTLLAGLPEIMERGALSGNSRNNQISLFGGHEEPDPMPQMPLFPEFAAEELLEMEKEAAGLYLSGHPLDQFREEFVKHNCYPIGELDEAEDKQVYSFGGRVVRVKAVQTRKGQTMGFVVLEDFTGSAECIVFPDLWSRSRKRFEKDQLVLVRARVDAGEVPKLVAESVETLEKNLKPACVYLRVDPDKQDRAALSQLKELLLLHPGSDTVRLVYMPERKQLELQQKIRLNQELQEKIEAILGGETLFVREEET